MPSKRRALQRHEARRLIAEHCVTGAAAPLVGLELEFLTFAGVSAGRPALDTLERIAASRLDMGGRVTLEPGGQIELSTAPQASAVEAIAAAGAEVEQLRSRAARVGIEMLAVGTDRWRPPERVLDSTRYRCMEAHFDTLGTDGRRMMCNTASLQLNIDAPAGLESDTWLAAHAIGPAMLAAFANSPDESGWKSTRMAIWLAMEPARCSAVDARLPLPDAWIDYAFAAPTLVGRDDDGACVPLPTPTPFGAWLAEGSDIGFPTAADLAYHLTMLFPPVRPRRFLELRYLDALPSPWWEVATVVVSALLDRSVLGEVRRAVAGTESLWTESARYALDDERLALAADRCFALALAATDDAGVADYAERYVAKRVAAWA